jgi:hypothetical protein
MYTEHQKTVVGTLFESRVVVSVHKTSDSDCYSDSFLKAQYDNGKPTKVVNGTITHFITTM